MLNSSKSLFVVIKRTNNSNSNIMASSSSTSRFFNLISLLLIWSFLETGAGFHLKQHSQQQTVTALFTSNNYNTNNNKLPYKIIYANGLTEETLPECKRNTVCNKIDTYDKPWIEKQCKCPSHFDECSTSLLPNDGHTIIDKTRQYKLCEPVRKIPKCRNYFRDVTWTLRTLGDNLTQHIHCQCPKDSTAYMIKRQVYTGSITSTSKESLELSNEDQQVNQGGFKYSFACNPPQKILCQRKEPCRLFTLVKRKSNVTEVNTSALCKCPKSYQCPSHHTDNGVIAGKFYPENLRTYSGYCV